MKKLGLLLFGLALLLVAFPIVFAHATAETFHMGLSYQAAEILSKQEVKKANEVHFGSDFSARKNHPRLELTIKSLDYKDEVVNVKGNGVVKIGDKTFPIVFNDNISKVVTNSGANFYYGTVTGEIKNLKNKQISVMNIFAIPSEKKYLVTLTSGEFGVDEGIGMIAFGEKFDEYLELIRKEKEKALNEKEKNIN